jgi:hypothetical protein
VLSCCCCCCGEGEDERATAAVVGVVAAAAPPTPGGRRRPRPRRRPERLDQPGRAALQPRPPRPRPRLGRAGRGNVRAELEQPRAPQALRVPRPVQQRVQQGDALRGREPRPARGVQLEALGELPLAEGRQALEAAAHGRQVELVRGRRRVEVVGVEEAHEGGEGGLVGDGADADVQTCLWLGGVCGCWVVRRRRGQDRDAGGGDDGRRRSSCRRWRGRGRGDGVAPRCRRRRHPARQRRQAALQHEPVRGLGRAVGGDDARVAPLAAGRPRGPQWRKCVVARGQGRQERRRRCCCSPERGLGGKARRAGLVREQRRGQGRRPQLRGHRPFEARDAVRGPAGLQGARRRLLRACRCGCCGGGGGRVGRGGGAGAAAAPARGGLKAGGRDDARGSLGRRARGRGGALAQQSRELGHGLDVRDEHVAPRPRTQVGWHCCGVLKVGSGAARRRRRRRRNTEDPFPAPSPLFCALLWLLSGWPSAPRERGLQ